jgi:hypothetical protein
VAVKYIVTTDGDTTTAAAAANEAVLGRLLAHPNVVQTFSAKTITIDGPFFDVSGATWALSGLYRSSRQPSQA